MPEQPRTLDVLSAQQLQCVRLVAQGLRSKEIARQLGLSAHTVDGHLRKAISRLGVSGRLEAARLVSRLDGHPQPLSAQPLSVDPASSGDDEGQVGPAPTRVREERLAFGDFPTLASAPIHRSPNVRGLSALNTVLLIAGLIAAAAVALSCAYPLGVGAQHLADWLSPRSRN